MFLIFLFIFSFDPFYYPFLFPLLLFHFPSLLSPPPILLSPPLFLSPSLSSFPLSRFDYRQLLLNYFSSIFLFSQPFTFHCYISSNFQTTQSFVSRRCLYPQGSNERFIRCVWWYLFIYIYIYNIYIYIYIKSHLPHTISISCPLCGKAGGVHISFLLMSENCFCLFSRTK